MGSLIIKDMPSSNYRDRTIYNCHTAGVTLAIAVDFSTAGEILTKRLAGTRYYAVPYEDLKSKSIQDDFVAFLEKQRMFTRSLHVAGNGIGRFVKIYGSGFQPTLDRNVYVFLKHVHERFPLNKIYSGGQSGVDEAGVKAGLRLGLHVEATLPRGYRMRGEDNLDRSPGLASAIRRLTRPSLG